jgi:hypothetical protein
VRSAVGSTYREVLPRALASGPQDALPRIAPTWLAANGSLDPERLPEAFLVFWRRHGQPRLGSALDHESAPHLVPMAFLHPVVNGGGTLEREYAIGLGRMDLCLRYGALTLAMGLKVWWDGAPDPFAQGLEQLDGYLAGLGLDTGWLVVFDRRCGQPPIAERTASAGPVSPAGRSIVVVRASQAVNKDPQRACARHMEVPPAGPRLRRGAAPRLRSGRRSGS